MEGARYVHANPVLSLMSIPYVADQTLRESEDAVV